MIKNNPHKITSIIKLMQSGLSVNKDGVICYKVFIQNKKTKKYEAVQRFLPKHWKIKSGKYLIEENVDYDNEKSCSSGVNVASYDWITRHYPNYKRKLDGLFNSSYNHVVWKCLIKWEDIATVCYPTNNDGIWRGSIWVGGKFRARRVKLLKKLKTY